MSIVLKAFPLGFLVNGEQGADENYFEFERKNLQMIKVATNMKLEDVNYIMEHLGMPCKYKNDVYTLNNGITLHWGAYDGYYCAFIMANDKKQLFKRTMTDNEFTKQAELLFKNFDVILRRNTRDVGSKEVFYYCYRTPFSARYEVLHELKKYKIENITKNTENEIFFRYDNKDYKFKRNDKKETFYIEFEQKISLVNIKLGGKFVTNVNKKTNYLDKDTLIKTLTEHEAVNLQADDFNVSCEIYGMRMLFSKDYAQGPYNLQISQVTDEAKCNQLLKDLEDEYNLNIQDITYHRIMEQIKNQNLTLESEEVDDDNSIILTIDLG